MNTVRKWARSPDVQALGLLALTVLLFFLPAATLRGVYFYGDAVDYFSRLSYGAARLRAGQIALWNPYLSLGGPHAADPAAMPWYPIHWLLFILLPSPLAFNYDVLLHVLLAASGMFCLARAWGQTRASALVAGLVYGFNGFAMAHLQHLNIVIALAWMPWLFLCLEKYLSGRRSLYLALGSLALGMAILGGHTQLVLIGGLGLGAYTLVRLAQFWREGNRGRLLSITAGLVVWVGLALGLSAIFLVPSVELLNFISRAGGVSYDYATTFSLVPERLVGFIFPFAFGGSFWRNESGTGSLIEMSCYLGILGLALVPLGLARKNWRTLFLAAAALVALLLALGRYTPLYALVFHLPLLGTVRAPARFLAFVVFALALAAGFGLDVLRARKAGRVVVWCIAGLTLVALAAVGLGASGARRMLPISLARAVQPGPDTVMAIAFILGAALILALWARGILPERVRLGLTLVFVAADLFFFNANLVYNQVAGPGIYTAPGQNARQILADGDTPRIYYWASSETKLASYLQQRQARAYVEASAEGLRQSLPMNFGVTSLQGYGSEPPAYTEWMNGIGASQKFDAAAARLIGLYAGRYILTQSTLDQADLHLVARAGRINLYRNEAALPYVYLVGQTFQVPDQASALRAIQNPAFDPHRTVVLEGGLPASESALESTVTLRTDDPERIVVATQDGASSYLVLNDAFYPGWQAAVDGQIVPIYRANALVRAVQVPPGAHTVEFAYDPVSVKMGTAISAIFLVILLVFLVLGWRH